MSVSGELSLSMNDDMNGGIYVRHRKTNINNGRTSSAGNRIYDIQKGRTGPLICLRDAYLCDIQAIANRAYLKKPSTQALYICGVATRVSQGQAINRPRIARAKLCNARGWFGGGV